MIHKLGRRDFLKVAGIGAAATTLGCGGGKLHPLAHGSEGASRHGLIPTRIIFLVSDGMSMGVPTMAEALAQRLRGRSTVLEGLLRNPRATVGLTDTRSLSSLVTDSAAASCAWGSGSRIFNGAVNQLPDGTALVPLCPLAKSVGWSTGLVTTTRLTHATPAGWAAVAANRGMEPLIAPQYLDKVDVLLGGGQVHFDAEDRWDGRDLYADYAAAGYTVWKTRDQMLARGDAASGRVLGCFTPHHLPYAIDHENDPVAMATVPSLAEMTRRSLELLDAAGKPFLLQVEGGRVDHGAHNNDLPATIYDQLAFDDAIAVALEYADKNPDTLVVVTTDHANSNPGLIGSGSNYNDSTPRFEQLLKAKGSVEVARVAWEEAAKAGNLTPAMVVDETARVLGLQLSIEEATILTETAKGRPPMVINDQHRSLIGIAGLVLGNHYAVQWTGVSHTSDHVLTVAIGAGQERFHGLLDNTDTFHLITEWMGVKHKNPSLTWEEGQRLLADAKE